MVNKAVFLVLLLAVATVEGRARGAKLGSSRSSRQQSLLWGRIRQDPQLTGYPQTPAPAGSAYPQPQQPQPGSFPPPPTYPPPTGGGVPPPPTSYPPQPTLTPAPVSQAGYPPAVVVPGVPPVPVTACKYPGFFPTPGSCVNFYRCVDWTGTGAYYSVFQFNCPLGTIFDDDLDICNHIGWTVGKRPECADMLHASLVPEGSGPPPPGAYPPPGTGAGAVVYPPPGVGTYPPPVLPPQPETTYPQPGTAYPQPGTTYPQPGTAYPQPGTTYPQPGAGAGTGTGSGSDVPPKPFSLQCYADDAYRRHPLYCNRYYRCAWDGADWVFPMQSCPEGLIFNEAGQLCADPATMAPCDGQLAPPPSPEVLATEAPTESPVTDSTTEQALTVDPSSLYDCPDAGYYSYESDCIRFYKCVVLDSGALKGLLYKCPAGYGYSDEKSRCDKEERLPTCDKPPLPASTRQAPAVELTIDMLSWFFNN